ncbi:TetR/AcrR family transcriptional regulator [Paenibacillus tuaregi]|uniref:TetR/AcrR family transcriptional regulator n=1 Tax=Paenibacillus tuaregi TaxID=1816681 RepID=UPI0008393A04|nr:TetR/AcrR family transcriptional regulator [Paenibacillus tuaregi]
MPKIVDHEKQKQLLAEATWRIICRHGIQQASVRHIAKEAHMSVGSLRHYFASQSDLFAYSMQLVSERVEKRIQSISFNGPPLEDMKKVLYQLLPIDEESRSEMEVWIAFTTKALSDPALKALNNAVYEKMRFGIQSIVEALISHNLAQPGLDPELETARLHALIDGLAMHAVISPATMSSERMQLLVSQHLDALCSQTGQKKNSS